MAALKDCDVIVAIGGRVEGPAAFILAIAREQRKLIIPFRFLGGASERVFNQIEGDLRQNLGGNVEKLSSEIDGEEGFLALIQILHSKSFVKPVAQIRIFLSYSWRRGEYADFVEATVRRMENVFLFRDESEIISGDSISAKIDLELTQRCNVFLALWGREYVESPHCYDEMHRWYEMNGLDRLCLLRFDETRPVWPILRKTRNDTNEFVHRWPQMDMLQNRSVLEKELRNLINRMTPL